jgi:hypothetical protein
MALLTLFSAPKPFVNAHISTIQRNAIQTWKRLEDTRVFLVGNDPGVGEAAADYGVGYFPNVARNAAGTPLISSIFEIARSNSDSPLLAYVNADILLFPDFVDSARRVDNLGKGFLIVGRRWDLDLVEPLDFSTDWASTLRRLVAEKGSLHRPMGSDYFIYPRICFTELPDFAVGRAGWDNWMIYRARKERWLCVDATRTITIVHQNHDYSHLPDGQIHHRLPESDENRRLANGRAATRFTLYDADRILSEGRLRRPPLSAERLVRAVEAFPILYLDSPRLSEHVRRLTRDFWRRRTLG